MPIKITKADLFKIIARNIDIPLEEVNDSTCIPPDSELSITRVSIEIDIEDELFIHSLTIKESVTNVGELITMLKGMERFADEN